MRKKLSGVKLAHHKNTANTASQPLPLPKRVRIPMSMHIGAPCSPLVKVRDSICVGQKIGDTDALYGCPDSQWRVRNGQGSFRFPNEQWQNLQMRGN